MDDKYLTPNMIFREARKIADNYNIKINNVFVDLDSERLSITFKNQEKYCSIIQSDLLMSIDDFSERIIHPLVLSLTDWNKAFKMETWIKS